MSRNNPDGAQRFSRGFALLFSLVMLGLAVVALTTDLSVLYLKIFVDFIAAGRSTFKVTFLFVFLAVLGLSWLARQGGAPSRPAIGWGLGLMLMTYLLSLFEHFALAHELGYDPHGPIIYITDGIQSQTTSYHNHVGKVVLGGLLSAIPGTPLAPFMDYGYPFMPYLPLGLVAVHAVVFLGMFLSILMVLAKAVHARALSTPWYSIMILSGFSLIKCSIDGGLLCAEVMVSLPLFMACCHFLCLRQDGPHGTPAKLWLSYGIPATFFYVATFPFSTDVPWWLLTDMFKLSAVRLASVYAVVFLVSSLALQRRFLLSVLALATFIILYLQPLNVFGLGGASATNLGYAQETIHAGQCCYACVRRQEVASDDAIEILSSIPTKRRQIIHFRAKRDLKIHEIRNIRLILHHYEVHRLGVVNPRIYAGRLKAQLIIPGGHDMVAVDPSIKVPGVGTHGLRAVGGGRYILEMTLVPPTSMFPNILEDYLNQVGLNRVILTSLEVS